MKEARLDGSVKVHVGEPFRIGLRMEGATGRRWDLSTPDAIQTVETITEAPQKAGMTFGARPVRYHVFECIQPGDYKIALRLHRPWEADGEHHVVCVRCD